MDSTAVWKLEHTIPTRRVARRTRDPTTDYRYQQTTTIATTIQKTEQEVNTGRVAKNDDVLTAIKEITQTMQKQQMYFEKRSVDNEGQMTSLVEALIKEQRKRDLDGLMSLIPIFKDSEPENCAEWISQVKNGCAQSGRHLRQELINKSETMVQTFIRNQGDIEDDELVDKLLTFFSDIPTPAHAAAKLRQIKQQENESVMKFNQRYKQYFERAEGELVDNVRSRLQMEMYLDAIVAPVTHSIRQNIYYATKHAPKSLGEAMCKAEDGYMKEIYTRGEYNPSEDVAKKEVVCNEVNNGPDKGNTGFLRKQRYENQYTGGYSNRPQSQFTDTTDGQLSRMQWKYTENDKKQGNYQRTQVTEGQPSTRPQSAHNLPRGSLTHILVNPLNLDDTAFNAWLDRLVDPVKVHEVFIEHIDTLEMEVPCEAGMEVKLPIPRKQMVKLQKGDSECRDIVKKLRNNVQSAKIYFLGQRVAD